MPALTVREYDPESGALLGNISSLNFGRVTAGTSSVVKVIDIAFSDVTSVSNVKLGIVSSGGLTVNSNPTDISADGSASNGQFGVESSSTFDASKSTSGLTRFFAGLNGTASAGDSNNVTIGNRSDTLSDYSYLSIQISASNADAGNGAYKVFFDYS
jgi:hypothetical protein